MPRLAQTTGWQWRQLRRLCVSGLAQKLRELTQRTTEGRSQGWKWHQLRSSGSGQILTRTCVRSGIVTTTVFICWLFKLLIEFKDQSMHLWRSWHLNKKNITERICPKSKPGTFHLEKTIRKNALVTRPAGLLLGLLLLLQ